MFTLSRDHALRRVSALVLLLFVRSAVAQSEPSAFQRQLQDLMNSLQGKRVALLTNPTGVDDQYDFIADKLIADASITLVCFFAPEHGLRGDQQAGAEVQDYEDPISGLPVYSLYGSRRAPTPEQLEGVDVLLVDIQEVGVRFYTRLWIMTYCMESAAANGVECVVFDRPNPIGCHRTEGAPITFDGGIVGRLWQGQPFGIPTRHGMTIGEIARLVNEEWMNPKVQLEVIPVPGYTRSMKYEQTGFPWVPTSPNMPTKETATAYPGMCVFEGTNLSEGRGTTKPFEMVGAPFINASEFANTLNALNLPGVRFRAAYFTPSFDDHAGEQCGGIQIHVTNHDSFDPIRTGLHVLKTAVTMYPNEVTLRSYVSTLMGVPNLHTRILTEQVDTLIAGWQTNLDAFKEVRAKYLIYPEEVGDVREP